MRNLRSASGFGLVEALTATLITMVGVLSVAALFLAGARMQSAATNSSGAIGLAAAELGRTSIAVPAPRRRWT